MHDYRRSLAPGVPAPGAGRSPAAGPGNGKQPSTPPCPKEAAMKTYRRILVSIAAAGETHILLQRAAGLAQAQQAQLLVVRSSMAAAASRPTARRRVAAGCGRTPRAGSAAAARPAAGAEQSRLGGSEVLWGVPRTGWLTSFEPGAGSRRHLCRRSAQGSHEWCGHLKVGRRSWASRLLGSCPAPAPPDPLRHPPG